MRCRRAVVELFECGEGEFGDDMVCCRFRAVKRSARHGEFEDVFTHMFDSGICFYLREFRRILKRDGRVYATFFLVDEAIRTRIGQEPVTTWRLIFQYPYPYGDGCFINDPSNSVAAVAYTSPKMRDLITLSGLRLVGPFLPGLWSGMFPEADCGQDTMILGERSAPG
jgi:hypothetical protein